MTGPGYLARRDGGKGLTGRGIRPLKRGMSERPPEAIFDALRRMNLLGATGGERLTGGVSSDIWRIELPSGPICVKRALAKLRVAADWHAPVERNVFEARWMRHAAGFAPRLLGQDSASGTLAMEFLSPETYSLWKTELRDGLEADTRPR